MNITICNRHFDTNTINDLTITKDSVLIDTEEDFYRIRYTSEEDIVDAKAYLQFKTMQMKDLMDAIMMIITTCDYFINSKNQCAFCPLKRNQGCIFNSNPIDWRN